MHSKGIVAARCFLLTLALLSGTLWAQQYRFRGFDQADGLQDLVVRDVVQDGTGFLWIATHTGLYRYDGSSFRRFTTDDGLLDNWATDLAVTPDGSLWVATIKGICVRGKQGFLPVLPAQQGISFSPSRGTPLAVSGQNRVFATTMLGILQISRNPAVTTDPLASPFSIAFVYGDGKRSDHDSPAIALPDGSLRFIDEQGNLCALDPRTRNVRRTPAALPAANYTALLRGPDASLWAANRNGSLYHLPPDAHTFRLHSVEYAGSGRLALTRDGSLLVPSGTGFAIVGPSSLEFVDAAKGFPAETVEVFAQDRDGGLWLGTAGSGLFQWLGYQTWTSWGVLDGLPASYVSRSAFQADGTQWLATTKGLARRSPGESRFHSFPLPPERGPRNPVYALEVSPAGDLWLSNHHGQLLLFNPAAGTVVPFEESNGFPLGMICDLKVRDGVLYIADTLGVARLLHEPNGWRIERLYEGHTKGGTAYQLAFDTKGQLWAATEKGLLSWTPRRSRWFTEKHGLQSTNIFSVAVTPDDTVWVAYRLARGLSMLTVSASNSRVTHFRESDGLLSDKVFALLADERGWIWAGSERGLNARPPGYRWLSFTQDDGLVWNDCNVAALAADPQRNLWVGTSRGLSRVNPRNISYPQSLSVAPVSLRFGQSPPQYLHPGDTVPAPAEFSLTFAALRFTNQNLLEFRYRFGDNQPWMLTREREVHFASVGPGSHRFQVEAREIGSAWSHLPSTVTLEVPTPWWRHWLTYLIVLWLIAAALRLAWRIRYARMVQRQHELEHAVGERTKELERQTERAEAASRFKDQILANVSHEMRTPLNGILGFTGMVLDSDLSEEQRENLRTVQASGKSLIDIIEDLLDFAALEAGNLSLHPQPVDVRAVVDQVLRTLHFEAARKQIHLRSEYDPAFPAYVETDAHRLSQILLHLLSNAVKFSDHGTVLISIGLAPRPPERSRQHPESVLAEFAVRDQGVGIAPEKLALIFEPFRQVDGSIRRSQGGTGLGLAMVQKIAEGMGGSVSVESTPAVGSCFRVQLPLRVSATPPALPVSEALPPLDAPRIRKVLIAEDNPVNQKLLSRILSTRGLHVVAVNDGEAAVHAFASDQFDLVLMDIQMPVMDGIEATRRIRQSHPSASPRVPIIAVTANGLFQCRDECFAVGMDGYVVKPFGPANLFKAIEEASGQPLLPTPSPAESVHTPVQPSPPAS